MKKYRVYKCAAFLSFGLNLIGSDTALINSLQTTTSRLILGKNKLYNILPTQGRLEYARLKLLLIQKNLHEIMYPVVADTFVQKAIADKQYNEHQHPSLFLEVLKNRAIRDKITNDMEIAPATEFFYKSIIDKLEQDGLFTKDNQYLSVIADKAIVDTQALQNLAILQISNAIMDKMTIDIALLTTITGAQILQAINDKLTNDISEKQAEEKAAQEKAVAELAIQQLLKEQILLAIQDKITIDQTILTEQNNQSNWLGGTQDKATTDEQAQKENDLAVVWLQVILNKAESDIAFVQANRQSLLYGAAINDKATLDVKNFIADPLQRKRFYAIVDKATI